MVAVFQKNYLAAGHGSDDAPQRPDSTAPGQTRCAADAKLSLDAPLGRSPF